MDGLLEKTEAVFEFAKKEMEKSRRNALTLESAAKIESAIKSLDKTRFAVMDALEKLMPKKPKKEEEENLFCPTCNCFLGFESVCRERNFNKPHCSCCGQAIDWGE